MLRSCPNESRIKAQNRSLDRVKSFVEIVPGVADVDALEAPNALRAMIDEATVMASELSCRRCGGVVIDLATGQAYCGREAPSEVLENNRKLAAN